ncbi:MULTISPECIES: BON domain-containing protein [Sinorhizobium]|uniref:BON domain-containing protein n=1 Tax=Sinorhizobium mexicanum TaxID=375549 RepID=A0A859QG56_9HYPH|nr:MULTISPECIES: BON domain-containing protein [Sinorhizobium]MBP1887230.1 osmotically-inducible protein OsmY [Sinorhizobium mexicanum]MDK1377511.1 BON domain-containing protein [Sinorhizobium sp. 6-70]MDK1479291.1 BON domain-containing protein [Sinorhizobium sp. 6-117]QLL60180.1 BON domain-containing protein [Sinorhizobium mexicanum]
MPTDKSIYSHRDDDPHLTDDDLAEKVLRFIRYATFVDTSGISVMALGGMVVLSGNVAEEPDIACAGEAAASVIGVSGVENRLTVRPDESTD